jgi:hypothetical protein
MAKKSLKKKVSKQTGFQKEKTPKKSKEKLEEKVIQNLVTLQKVHVNLAEKFESLSNQISNLLALFEMSARTFANQPHAQRTERDKEFLDKIDKLLDQNKVLAKGLTLMEEKMKERLYGPGARTLNRVSPRRNTIDI